MVFIVNLDLSYEKSILQCGPCASRLAGADGTFYEGHAAHSFFNAAYTLAQLCVRRTEPLEDGLREIPIDVGEGLNQPFGMTQRKTSGAAGWFTQKSAAVVECLVGPVKPFQLQASGVFLMPIQASLFAVHAQSQLIALAGCNLRCGENRRC